MVLDGRAISMQIKEKIKDDITNTGASRIPCLAVVIVGDNSASQIYVRNKRLDCEQCGIKSIVKELPESSTTAEVCNVVRQLSADIGVDGIIVQLPLPKHIDTNSVISIIPPAMDVDCFTIENIGLLYQQRPYLTPCTPTGIIALLDAYGIKIEGKHCVMIGRSNIVGRPMTEMMLQRNATVTVCHTRTANLYDIATTADILISAVGIPNFIKSEMIKIGATVIDVGMNRGPDGKLVGDCTMNVYCRASAYTPVPGGVGPMTRAMLMQNTFKAWKTNFVDF